MCDDYDNGDQGLRKSFRDSVVDILKSVDPKAAERYAHCHEPGYGFWWECDLHPDDHPAEYVPFSCMLRICPRCAESLASQVRRRYQRVIQSVVQAQRYKRLWGWRLRHVTLTSSYELAPDDMGAVARDLLDAARETYKTLWGKDGAGAVATLEVGERGRKFHIHMLVWGPFVDHKLVKEEWHKRTGQTSVWIEEMPDGVSSIGEALKYVTKFASLTPGQLVDLHMALKGTRRIRAWGSFYNVDAAESEVYPERVCSVCGARMVLTPELDVENRRARAAEGGLILTTANKSPPRVCARQAV